MLKVLVAGGNYMGIREGVERNLRSDHEFEVVSFPNCWKGAGSAPGDFHACLFTGPHDTFYDGGSRAPADWLMRHVVGPDKPLVVLTTIGDKVLGTIPAAISHSSRHVDFWRVWDAMHGATGASPSGLDQLFAALQKGPPEDRFKYR